ncbi:MAG: hypothetical protein JXO22_14965 [Phycisphaerae bacterium]|nr:hypothetical protein [Phycisphaerae bacterium]
MQRGALLAVFLAAPALADFLLPADWCDIENGVSGASSNGPHVISRVDQPPLPYIATNTITHDGVTCSTAYDFAIAPDAAAHFCVDWTHTRAATSQSYTSSRGFFQFIPQQDTPYFTRVAHQLKGWASLEVQFSLFDYQTQTYLFEFEEHTGFVQDPGWTVPSGYQSGLLLAHHSYWWHYRIESSSAVPTAPAAGSGFAYLFLPEPSTLVFFVALTVCRARRLLPVGT